MAKAKTASTIDTDELRDLIEPARAIAEALSSIDEDCGLAHDSLWRLGNLIDQNLTKAVEMLDRFDKDNGR